MREITGLRTHTLCTTYVLTWFSRATIFFADNCGIECDNKPGNLLYTMRVVWVVICGVVWADQTGLLGTCEGGGEGRGSTKISIKGRSLFKLRKKLIL